MEAGTVFNIQKFCINDGPGIRTTVFLKGCPLNCLWCHNPESKAYKPEIFYDSQKCVLCGRCENACPVACHSLHSGMHLYDRTGCTACGACAKACPVGALEMAGYTATVSEVLTEVMKDKVFYDNSGGGLTLSGGEPMYQFQFTYALLTAAKAAGLHTCMETCGFAPTAHFRQVATLVDIFLFDYKETDPDKHREFTGASNIQILQNLYMLDSMGAKSILRCPIIPGCNDRPEHFAGIAETANRLKNILRIEIEPYHPLGKSKAQLLGKDYPLRTLTFPEEKTVGRWMEAIAAKTTVPVMKA